MDNKNKIKNLVENNFPLMLVGPAGCGKSHILEEVATDMGLEFYPVSSVGDEYKLTGFIDANGRYNETLFYKAFKNGGVFFMDEIDNSNPSAVVVLNGAIANGYFDFPCGKVDRHPDFRVVAAANTYGHGADSTYVGRNALDGATLDRFVQMDFFYNAQVEELMTGNKKHLDMMRQLREYATDNYLKIIVSYRGIKSFSWLMDNGYDLRDSLKMSVCKGIDEETLNMIIKELENGKPAGTKKKTSTLGDFEDAVNTWVNNEFRAKDDSKGLYFKKWHFGTKSQTLYVKTDEAVCFPIATGYPDNIKDVDSALAYTGEVEVSKALYEDNNYNTYRSTLEDFKPLVIEHQKTKEVRGEEPVTDIDTLEQLYTRCKEIAEG